MNQLPAATPLDIIAECMNWLVDDKPTLKVFSLASHDVRRLAYRHLFRRIRYISGCKRAHTLNDLLRGLEAIPHITAHVREFVVAPQRPYYWGLYSATQITPCLLWNIITHFPLLTDLTLRSFTLRPCTHEGACIPIPPMINLRNVQISRVLLGPLCHLDDIAHSFQPTTTLTIRYIFPMRPFPTSPALRLPTSLEKLDIHIPLDSGVEVALPDQAPPFGASKALWYDVWTPLQTLLRADCSIQELSVAWTLSIVARSPGASRNYMLDLSSCAHLHTVTLEAPLAAFGGFVAHYVAETLVTLPRTVHTVHLAFNPFRRSERDPYANPNSSWKEVWRALARTNGVRAIHLHFSDMESVARLSYRDVPLVREDTIVDFAQAALTDLTKVGYVGTFAYTVEGTHV